MPNHNIGRQNSNITISSCVYFFHRGLPVSVLLIDSLHAIAQTLCDRVFSFQSLQSIVVAMPVVRRRASVMKKPTAKQREKKMPVRQADAIRL